jgi:hypothetical protein
MMFWFNRKEGNPLSKIIILFTRVQAAVQSQGDYTPPNYTKPKDTIKY